MKFLFIILTLLTGLLLSPVFGDANCSDLEDVEFVEVRLDFDGSELENIVPFEDDLPTKNTVEVPSAEPWTKVRFTDEEYRMVCRMVEAEATGGDLDSKINVANVIINRVLSPDFPDTVEGVLFQKRQFSPIADGRYYEVKVTESTKNAVDRANRGLDTTHGSTFFMVRGHSDMDNITWFDQNLEFVKKDDLGHEFFR